MNQLPTPPHDPATTDPQVVTSEAMNTAIADGTATYLSQVMTGFARHRDTWWIEEIGRWLAVDDPVLAEFLDKHFAAAQAMQQLFNKQ